MLKRRAPMFRSLILVIATFVVACCVSAQNANGILDGRITDSTGPSIPGAKVTVENQAQGTGREPPPKPAGRFNQGQVFFATHRQPVEKTAFQKNIQHD